MTNEKQNMQQIGGVQKYIYKGSEGIGKIQTCRQVGARMVRLAALAGGP
jgi:hypothetical protein